MRLISKEIFNYNKILCKEVKNYQALHFLSFFALLKDKRKSALVALQSEGLIHCDCKNLEARLDGKRLALMV
jgi:hypothetical protein